jgi:hypothetical protein
MNMTDARRLTSSQEAVSGILYHHFAYHPDGVALLMQCGIEAINAAVDEVVDRIGELYEIGSSDRWEYIRRAERAAKAYAAAKRKDSK